MPVKLASFRLQNSRIINSRERQYFRSQFQIYQIGQYNLNYNNYIYHKPSLYLFSLIAKQPLMILIKGDLAPLSRAFNWINWKDSWLSWHLTQQKQITVANINDPYLIITKNNLSLSFGNSKDFISIIDTTNGISNNQIRAYDLAILGAHLVWKAHLNNLLID